MALATSGALTLDQIHVEAGGTTGTTCSLNDSDIRGLTAAAGKTINSTLGTTIDFDDFYGASGALTSATITVGQTTSNIVPYRYRGYDTTYGSISPSNPVFTGIANGNYLSRAFLFGVISQGIGSLPAGTRRIFVQFDNTNTVSNTNSSAFTSVNINGTTFNRSAATFTSSGSYRWYWTESSGGNVDDATSAIPPFPAVGQTCTISFS
jgi:hypothetical protein